jgi:hypothetical protein
LISVQARYLQCVATIAAVAAVTAGHGPSRRPPLLVVAFFDDDVDERIEVGRQLVRALVS